MRALVYLASRDKVDVDAFHKDIQCALENLGKSKFGFERTVVSNFKSKRRVGSGNTLVDYSRAPCLGAEQKARGSEIEIVIRFARISPEHAQSDRKSVNRRLPVLDLPRGFTAVKRLGTLVNTLVI